MAPPPPAELGMPLEEVDTPALLVDLDVLERNLRRMADSLRGLPVRLRPHAKSHKCPEIARRQMALGAVGVCCQKVSEAEALVEGGIADVLVSNEVVGRRKLERLAALARQARVAVCVDDAGNVDELDADYARNLEAPEASPPFELSLFVLATVMSRPAASRAVVDAGLKAFSVDSGLPLVHGRPDIVYTRAMDGHGVLEPTPGARLPALGEKLLLVPGHCDPTVNLYDWYVAVRGGRVEALWPITARGAVW